MKKQEFTDLRQDLNINGNGLAIGEGLVVLSQTLYEIELIKNLPFEDKTAMAIEYFKE